MSMTSRVNSLVSDLTKSDNWEERYKYIIQKGKTLAPLPEEYRLDQNKVKGCQSQVWLYATLEEGKVSYYVDSDAIIVKGILSLLMAVYNDATPEEILSTQPDFIDTIGLKQHLSPSRANGLSFVLKHISLYALAYKEKMKKEA
ncbi:SufE family protein [bacterium]|nr:SufE family protein [bacterium]